MRTVRALLVGLLVALLATGCVSVPTSGPVEKVVGEPPACQDCVNVEVAPPAPGDSPLQIVEGYLRATSNFQPDYAVARQFLSAPAAKTWNPAAGVNVYDGRPIGDDAGVRLRGRLVASLKDRTYQARDESLNLAFPLVQENGQWRINRPPPGLFVAEFAFRDFYQPVNRYFLSNGIGASLVPDPIYVLSARNPANLASGLVTSLLDGPSDWLEPAVKSAIPPDTTLSVDSVPITDGIAEVALSDNVLTLNEPERALLAAQIVYTLKQLSIIKGVVITVNQQKFRVPQSDPATLVVGVDDIEPGLQPIPPVASSQLYALQNGKIRLVEKTNDATTVTTLDTDVGRGRYEMDSLAVSVTNTDLALVTDGRTKLRLTQTTPGAPVSTPLGGVSKLLRPQFSRYGEVWAIGQQNGRQKIYKFGGEPLLEDPNKKFFAAGEITAFKISPDGTRMALIRRTRSGSELGVARISRTDKVRVDGWRVLDTTQSELPKITRMLDVGWIDPTTMLVLGAATTDSGVEPFEVSEDAAQISNEGVSNNWEAVEVAVQLPGPVPVVRGQDKEKQTYVDNGSEWLRLVDGVDAIAYPG